MAKRECVNLFDDQLEVVSFLTDEQLGCAVRAAMQFVRDGAEPKLDIHDWSPDHSRCTSRGTFTHEEARALIKLLKKEV